MQDFAALTPLDWPFAFNSSRICPLGVDLCHLHCKCDGCYRIIEKTSINVCPNFCRPVSAFSLFLKSNAGCPIRCLATSNQGVAKVKMHSRTPYIIFVNDKMADVRNANPGTVIGTVLVRPNNSLARVRFYFF